MADSILPPGSENFKAFVANELRAGDLRMDEIVATIATIKEEQAVAKILLAENTDTINKIKSDTDELIAVLDSWRGAMRVIDWIGSLARPISYIVAFGASVAALWAAIKSGNGPK